MRLVISKSTIKKNMENNKLDFYKKQLLAILDKKEKEEKKDINKSLEFIEKGNGLPPGTKKEWPAGSGKWYVKTGQGKWIRTYNNSSSRGAKQSIAYMRKRIQNAESLEDLLNIVQENKDKFTDENGKPIDIVKDLMKDVHTKHQDFKGAKKEASKAAEKVMGTSSSEYDDDKAYEEYKKLVTKENPTKEENERIGTLVKEHFKHSDKPWKGGEGLKAEKAAKKEKDPEMNSNNAENEQDKRLGSSALWDQKLKNAINTNDKDKIKNAIKEIESEYEKLSTKTKTKDEKDFLESELKHRKRDADNALSDIKAGKIPKSSLLSALNTIVRSRETTDEQIKTYEEKLKENPGSQEFKIRLAVAKKYKELGEDIEAKYKINDDIENGKFDIEESEAEKHQNRSDAMKGNKNAYKGGPKEEPKENKGEKLTPERVKWQASYYFSQFKYSEKHGLMMGQPIDRENAENSIDEENWDNESKEAVKKELNNLIKEKKDKWKAENEAKRPKQTFEDIKKNYQNAKSVQGNSKTIHIGNEKIKCHYKLVEAETPIASHDENTFQKTEGFPTNNGGTINDRDYENDNSAKEGVMRIAGNYDGRALEQPPIVTKDGIVVSGNNRTMSSKLAAKNGTDKEYIDELKDVIEDYGIDEEELSKFKNPRIILEIDKEHEGEYTTEEFAKYNKTDQKSKSTVEKAVEVSKTIKPDTIQSLAEHISEFDTLGDLYNNKKAAREFVDALVTNGVIQPNDMAQYYTEQAGLSENGKEFIETTLVGGIMNENNIRSLSGAGGKSLRQKLVRAIVPLIDNKGIGKEYTFNDELNKAVNIVLEIQQGGKFTTVQEYMDQGNLFGDTVDPLTGRLAQLLHENTQKEFAEKMREVEGGLRPSANGEFDIFLGECETRDSILDRILEIKNKVSKALDYVFSLFE